MKVQDGMSIMEKDYPQAKDKLMEKRGQKTNTNFHKGMLAKINLGFRISFIKVSYVFYGL